MSEFYEKKLLKKPFLAFKNGVKSLQTTGYNGAYGKRTGLKVSKSRKQIVASWILPKMNEIHYVSFVLFFWKNRGHYIFFRDLLTFSNVRIHM